MGFGITRLNCELYYKVFGCGMENAHDALADILATKECFFELKNRSSQKQVLSLRMEKQQAAKEQI